MKLIKSYAYSGITVCFKHIFFISFLALHLVVHSQQLAFPTAHGAGAHATGGRGKPVYVVTNLNNSGTGSFRQALENTRSSDGGIVTFAVSGTIMLTTRLDFRDQDNITIAGQTAPAGGITIVSRNSAADFSLRNVNNLIIRYIRFRPFYNPFPATELDSFTLNSCNNYIIDHCSFSWGTDENADAGIGHDYTWQRNLFAESNKTGMIMGAQVEQSYNQSFHYNMFYNDSHRFPNWQSDGRVDIVNNVIWNFRARLSVPQGGFQVNHIGNYYQYFRDDPPANTPDRWINWYPFNTTTGGNTLSLFPTIYTSGNFISNVLTDPNADNWFIWRFRFNPVGSQYEGVGQHSQLTTDFRTETPFPFLGNPIEVKSAVEAFEDVRYNVGANVRLDQFGNTIPNLDGPDTMYLNNVQNNIRVDYTQESNLTTAHYSAYHANVSTTPINSHPANYYSSLDGIPNAWKELKNLDLNTNYATFTWPSGYIGIEEFLNEVDATANPTTTITPNQTICQGEEVTVTATGGTEYQWNNGQNTASITVTPEETITYSVEITVNSGETQTQEVTITVNPIPEANAGDDQSICLGETITLTASGGSSFAWSNGATTQSITVNPTSTTTYSVEVTENDCTSTDEVTVTVNPVPTVSAGDDVTIASGQSVNLSASGATTYAWNTGQTGAEITVSPTETTTYTVTGTSNGCSAEDEVTVFVAGNIAAQVSEDQTICNGESVTLTASGGDNFLWSNGETTASITVNPNQTTTYSVEVYDNFENSDSAEVTVTVNPIPEANAGDDQSICLGETITLTASGGSSFAWSNGESTQSITVNPTSTTTYAVEVSENGCSSTDEVTVTVNPVPTVSAGDDVTIAPGQSVNLSASGATTYDWNTGQTGAEITVVPTETTTYIVTGTTNDCSAEDEVTVFVVGNIAAQVSEDQTICNGESATLTASGGDNFLWSNGETTASITVNPNQTTTYSVEVYDNFGNSDSAEVTVTVNPIPEANAGDDQSICLGETITLTASGGSSFAWSNGELTQSITVNPTSTTTYTVEVSENGCSSTDEVTVSVNPVPTVSAGDDVTIAPGQSVNLSASGATTYVWNTGQTGAEITVSPTETTTYNVTGTTNDCSAENEVTVFVAGNIAAQVSEDQTICNGESVTLTASGGDNFLWSNGETTASITVTPNQTTTYSVEVSDNFGNSDTAEVTITVNPIPEANAGDDQSICQGDTITLTASGGSTYAWSNGATTQSITVNPTSTSTYTVEVTENGCSSADQVIVTVNQVPELQISGVTTVVYGNSTTLTVNGADSYLWSNGATSNTITVQPEQSTTYEVTGSINGCSSSQSVTVTVENHVEAFAGEDQRICQGYEVTLTASGGSSYLWSTGATTQSITVSPTSNSTYSVTVFDGPYQDEASVNVFVDPNPNVTIVNGSDATILEGNFITLSATGANSYQWNNGATQPNIAVSPSATTIYRVTGFINDCSDQKEITVNVLERVVANAGNDVTICPQETATLTATGGDDYLWSTGETTQTIEVAPEETTLYTVTVFNELDFDEATVMVVVDQQCQTVILPDDNEDLTFAFQVYPNPVSETLFIQLNGVINISNLKMFDLAGKLLFSEILEQTNQPYNFEKQIDVSNFQTGLYFVRLEDELRVITKKILIQ